MENKLFNKILKEKGIKDKTLKIYFDNVKRLNDRKPIVSLKFLRNTNKIIDKISGFSIPTQKNYLNSILMVLNDNPEYQKEIDEYQFMFNELFSEIKAFSNTHQKTEREEKNWCSLQDLKNVLNIYKNLNRGIEKRNEITDKEYENLQMYLILALYLLQPPRRLEDYSNMKIIKSRNEIQPNQNYLVVISRNIKYFVIGYYKTREIYGTKEIKVPSKINTILNIFLKFNNYGYLIVNKQKQPMTSNQLGKKISLGIMEETGKRVCVNMIRKIFLSENIDLQEERRKQALAEAMAHNTNTQLTYVKI